MAIIDDALERKGLSAAAASRLAVGNPSLIKNMRAGTGEKRFNAEALRKLSAVLDLEFYFGPPREKTRLSLPGGFAEETVEPATKALHRQEALRQGFLPVPYHSAAAPDFRGTAPVALARQWLDASDHNPETLSFLPVTEDSMAPALTIGTLALIDSSQARPNAHPGAIWAYREQDRYGFARIDLPDDTRLILKPDNPSAELRLIEGAALLTLRVLGRVIWIGQHLP